MTVKKTLSIILLAGGKGSRIDSLEPKQFLRLNEKPIANYSLDTFLNLPIPIEQIVVVCADEYQIFFNNSLKHIRFAQPGKERQFSVMNGFKALTKAVDFVMIHDAARPFIEQEDILLLFEEGSEIGAATLATPITSTIKQVDSEGFVSSTLQREFLWEIQTPQLLKYSLLKKGIETITKENIQVTDDVALAELLHHPVKLVKGNPLNFKITTQKDLLLAHSFVESTKTPDYSKK